MTRSHFLTGTALAPALLGFVLLASVVGAAQAQTTASPIPFDARRGVFSFATGLERSLPAVVQVTTLGVSGGPTTGENEPTPMSSGSGVIIDAAEGIIVTNNHVIEGGQKFRVDMTDGRLFEATLIGTDKATDIAVLRIEATGLSQVEVANSDTLRTGDLAFAVGYPLGLDQTLTMGVVSGLNRSGMGDAVEDYIQTDAAVNSGNSGGPLLDSRGRLIGINTSILSGDMGGGNDGIAFAVPTRILLFVVGQLRTKGEVTRGRIGTILGSLTADRAVEKGLGYVRGAVVEDVAPGSPAERAGLMRGDIITRIQNRPVANAGSVQATIGIAPPGTPMTLVYQRAGRERTTTLNVELQSTEAVQTGATAVQAYGASIREVRPTDAQVGTAGALVVAVEGGSQAAARGLMAGDRITAVNGSAVASLADLGRLLGESGGAVLTVSRHGEEDAIQIDLMASGG